ncbi:MAG: hypothetical protein LBP36_03635 [Oscillospiraceae bacterium]|nr:hypothetical protein [Oscillospiraceae bacterium]
MKIEDILIKPDEDLLDPTNDIVFKAMLTSDNEASQQALKHIISDFTGLERRGESHRKRAAKWEYAGKTYQT